MNFYDYLKLLENPRVFCFDLNQYKENIQYLEVVVYINYEGRTYQSPEIKIAISGFCVWAIDRWHVAYDAEVIKSKGAELIINSLMSDTPEKYLLL